MQLIYYTEPSTVCSIKSSNRFDTSILEAPGVLIRLSASDFCFLTQMESFTLCDKALAANQWAVKAQALKSFYKTYRLFPQDDKKIASKLMTMRDLYMEIPPSSHS